MQPSSTLLLLSSLLAYILWRILRSFIISSPLHNIPGPSRRSWLMGNLYELFARDSFSFHMGMIERFGSAFKVYGPMGKEQLYITDPTALNHIFQKDQFLYDETPEFVAQGLILIGKSLITVKGQEHSKHRKILNPAFSVKHIKSLTPIFYPIAYQLREKLIQKISKGETEIDVLLWLSRTTLEFIGQGGLGHKFDALDESKKIEYAEAVKTLSPLTFSPLVTFLRFQAHFFIDLGLLWIPQFLLKWTPLPLMRQFKSIITLMHETSVSIYEQKMVARAKDGGQITGKDLMSLLLKANLEAEEDDRLPVDVLINQMTLFIFAGYDTNATAISRALEILATKKETQNTLRREIQEARSQSAELDYDDLMRLPYLDAVCREILRLYPPLSFFGRAPNRDTVLPLLQPIKSTDGKSEIRQIPLKKDTYIHISIFGANRNKAVWGDDSDEFRPERWLNNSTEPAAKIPLPGVYSSMMTFLGGSHACIGFKFAELEMKLIIYILLGSFEFSLTDKDIEWCLPGIQCPMVKGSNGTPSLPLKVSTVKSIDT